MNETAGPGINTGNIPIWSTDQFAPADRAEAWSEFLSASHLPWSLFERPDDSFRASASLKQFNNLRIIRCCCGALQGFRSRSEIAASNDDYLGILHVLKGSESLRIGSDEVRVDSGSFVIWDSSRPMSFRVPEHLEKISLILPSQAVTGIFPDVYDYCGKVIRGQEGLGAVFVDLVRSLEREMWRSDSRHLSSLIRPSLEMLSAVFTSLVNVSPETVGQAHAIRIRRYILRNLQDSDMTPRCIAEANGISLRYLHQLFEDSGSTVSEWIKERRLERSREDLLQTYQPNVTEIAFRWGFNDSSHFSRCFKARFGVSPRDYRVNHIKQDLFSSRGGN